MNTYSIFTCVTGNMEEIKSTFAYYDPSTNIIHGCEEETLTYYHEEGHKVWGERGIEQMLQTNQWAVIMAILPFLAIFTFKSIIMIFICCIPTILFMTSEVHAWIYAFKKYFKKKWTQ